MTADNQTTTPDAALAEITEDEQLSDQQFADALEAAFKRVSYFPENRGGQGFMDLLELRNMVPDAVRRLRGLQ